MRGSRQGEAGVNHLNERACVFDGAAEWVGLVLKITTERRLRSDNVRRLFLPQLPLFKFLMPKLDPDLNQGPSGNEGRWGLSLA